MLQWLIYDLDWCVQGHPIQKSCVIQGTDHDTEPSKSVPSRPSFSLLKASGLFSWNISENVLRSWSYESVDFNKAFVSHFARSSKEFKILLKRKMLIRVIFEIRCIY